MSAHRYLTDPNHTYVHFAVRHHATSLVMARFDGVAGEVTWDKEAETGSADITIDMFSVNTGSRRFDAHLASPDFFNALKFPTARFTAARAAFSGGRPQTIEGELTLLGQTHPVALACTGFGVYESPQLKAEVAGGDFTAVIRRSQWGMEWGISFGVPDEVALTIQIEAVRQG